ncbi:MAG: hypothetical protein ACRDZ8_20105 [Acidimicrobiales bacterium]
MRRIERPKSARAALLGVTVAAAALVLGLVVSAAPALAQAPVVATATAVIPGGPGTASCSTGLSTADQGTDTVDGITLISLAGSCSPARAQSSVSIIEFDSSMVESASSSCVVGKNQAMSSAVFNGMVITGPEVIHVDGYTLAFNQPYTNGTLSGLTALTITTPTGAVVMIASTACTLPYPMVVTAVNGAGVVAPAKASVSGRRAGFSSAAPKSSSSSLPTIAILALAICAFIAVNVIGVRSFRRRQRSAA